MKPRKLSLRSLIGRMFKKRPTAVALSSTHPKPTSARDRVRSGIEPLEGRIAPAVLVNGHMFTYNDIDGDLVKVTFSKDLFDTSRPATLPSALDAVFKFTGPASAASNFADTGPQQLRLIDLGRVAFSLQKRVSGLSVNVTADLNGGDGFAAIGAIKAGNHGLGTVVIDGDLGQIDAGTGTEKIGLGILVAQSIGKFGTDTQLAAPAPDLNTVITGKLGRLIVFEDVKGYIHVVDSTSGSGITQRGTIGSVIIRGSLIGDPTVAAASDNTGRIDASFDIGPVSIGTDVSDGIFGGGGKISGAITAGHAITSVTITGNVEGGAASDSGTITSAGTLGPVKVGGDLKGGAGLNSGRIGAGRAAGNVTIGSFSAHHDVIGGSGEGSGSIVSAGTLGNVHVFGNITGVGPHSGGISSSGNIKSVVVDGNLAGGATVASGVIEGLRNIGPVLIGGDVTGHDGAGSGAVVAGGAIARISVIGKVSGGKGANSGAIFGGHDPTAAVRSIGNVTVGGALTGDEGIGSGAIVSGGTIAAVQVGTRLLSGLAVQGGIGAFSGAIFADGGIASVSILRGVEGGFGPGSASIQARGLLGSVSIVGDLTGGAGAESASILSHENFSAARPIPGDIGAVNITGKLMGAGDRTALIEADGILGRATVGSIQGGNGDLSGAIVSGAGFVRSGATKFVAVAGLIEGGAGDHAGSIQIGGRLGTLTAGGLAGAGVRVANDIGVLRVNGDVSDSIVTARGQAIHGRTSDLAIGSITIGGSVSDSSIRAGYDIAGAAVNADAQIGNVRVTGDWTASVLASGVVAGGDGLFGTIDDRLILGANRARIVAQIASIIIGGSVEGTAGTGDNFGFVSQRVGSFSANGVAQPLTAATGQSFPLGTQGDTFILEVTPV